MLQSLLPDLVCREAVDRKNNKMKKHDDDQYSDDPKDLSCSKMVPICLFAFLCFLSGIFCFVLDKDWVGSLSPGAKIPLYTVVGMCLSFAFTFTFVDITNYIAKVNFWKYTIKNDQQSSDLLLLINI
jgi:hypothetical protein